MTASDDLLRVCFTHEVGMQNLDPKRLPFACANCGEESAIVKRLTALLAERDAAVARAERAAERILQDVLDLDPDDPEHPDTICISYDALVVVLNNALRGADAALAAASEPVEYWEDEIMRGQYEAAAKYLALENERLQALLAERDAKIAQLIEAGDAMADAIDAYHDRLSRSSMGQPSPMTGMRAPLILWRAAQGGAAKEATLR